MKIIDINLPLLHLSKNPNLSILKPVIPYNLQKRDSLCLEDTTIPRVCFAPTIPGCILGLQLKENEFVNGKIELNIYKLIKNNIKTLSNSEIIRRKLVFDANITGEIWMLDVCNVEKIGKCLIYNKVIREIKYEPIINQDLKVPENFLVDGKFLISYLWDFKTIINEKEL